MKNLFLKAKLAYLLRHTKADESKMEESSHLLEVLGTIIIAVVILIFFRQQIVNLFQQAIGTTTNEVNNLFQNVATE